jgi:hypothetical protein
VLLLKTNLITPEAATAQARAALAKSGSGAAHWEVLQYAAALQKNRVAQVEALEQLLQRTDDKIPARLTATVQ